MRSYSSGQPTNVWLTLLNPRQLRIYDLGLLFAGTRGAYKFGCNWKLAVFVALFSCPIRVAVLWLHRSRSVSTSHVPEYFIQSFRMKPLADVRRCRAGAKERWVSVRRLRQDKPSFAFVSFFFSAHRSRPRALHVHLTSCQVSRSWHLLRLGIQPRLGMFHSCIRQRSSSRQHSGGMRMKKQCAKRCTRDYFKQGVTGSD